MVNLRQYLTELATKKRASLGIGITKPSELTIQSLRGASQWCNIKIIGARVFGFDCIETTTPEVALIAALKNGTVSGIIRGQLDALTMRDEVCSQLGYQKESLLELSVLEDSHGRIFSIIPNVNTQGWTAESKTTLVQGMVDLFSKLGLPSKIGVLTAVRLGSLGRNVMLDETYVQAEKVVAWCRAQGLEAKNYTIEIEKALEDSCTLIVMQNGIVGNQVVRSLVFLGNCAALGFLLVPVKEVIVESFRNEIRFDNYLLFAAAMVNSQ